MTLRRIEAQAFVAETTQQVSSLSFRKRINPKEKIKMKRSSLALNTAS